MSSSRQQTPEEELPPPPPVIPPNVVPQQERQLHNKPNIIRCLPMHRPGVGRDGHPIKLLSNHFSVRLAGQDVVFYHYSVAIKSEDRHDVEGKGIGRKIMDMLFQTYSSELAGKDFAYDGEKSMFTVGPLPQKKFEFTVLLEETSARSAGGIPGGGNPSESDRKRSKRTYLSKTYKVEINFAAKISMKSITDALRGSKSEYMQDALRVLDIILRQQQAKRGCLLVRQSFFSADPRNYSDLGGGVSGCRGFHSSFHTTHGGLSLNMDVSTTMILTPGPVVEFLKKNQNARDIRDIDWVKAKRMLKNMRVKAIHSSMEFKIIGLSELPCNRQMFSKKVRDGDVEEQNVELSVFEYFTGYKKLELTWSAHVPCLDVGKPKRPNYLPIELCYLVPLQHYKKALSSQQRASLVEKSRQKPQERIKVVTNAVRNNHYNQDPILSSCGISIDSELIKLDGRVLAAPTLKVGNMEDCFPRNARWNFTNKRFWAPIRIERWAIVNFSAHCDMSHISRELISCGRNKGIHIERPYTLIEEERQWVRAGPVVRVEKMFEQVIARIPGPPQFLLCILPERKNSDIYGPWKKKNLADIGIVTQCIAPTRVNDQYLTNVLLKINSKLGGTNSLLDVEHSLTFPLINKIPTMILGMDVSHGSPGRSDIPSIAAVVGSRHWPLISRYRASVRTQSPKLEMLDCLYKRLPNGQHDGIMRELFLDFYRTSGGRKPEQIVIFRDGVSESQFYQVLNIELEQIIKAYASLGDGPLPKCSLIVAQKNHHTKFFQDGSPDNVPPGTVVDSTVVHPRYYDFYMCAHAGMIGTSRPAHYHVLLDEIGFSPDDLQQLVHSLSYVCQRSTAATSIVAPICYAHLAAQQVSQFIKFESTDNSSGRGPDASGKPFQELPELHEKVRTSMFFC